MKRFICIAIVTAGGSFATIAVLRYLLGDADWLLQAYTWTFPLMVGFFLGYGNALLHEKSKKEDEEANNTNM